MEVLTPWLETDEPGRAIQLQVIDEGLRADSGAIAALLHIPTGVMDRIHDSRLMFDFARQCKHLMTSKKEEWTDFVHNLDKGPNGSVIHVPTGLELPTTPSVEVPGGIFTFIGAQRTIWMKDGNWAYIKSRHKLRV